MDKNRLLKKLKYLLWVGGMGGFFAPTDLYSNKGITHTMDSEGTPTPNMPKKKKNTLPTDPSKPLPTMNPQKPTSSAPKEGLYLSRKITWVLGVSALCTFSALSIKAANYNNNNEPAVDPNEVIEYEYGSTNNKLESLDKGYEGGNEHSMEPEMKQEEQIDKDKKIDSLNSIIRDLRSELAAAYRSMESMEQSYTEYVLQHDPKEFSKLPIQEQRKHWLEAVKDGRLDFVTATSPKAKDQRKLDTVVNADGQSAFHLAVAEGNFSLLKFLLAGKSTEELSDCLNKKDARGDTPLGLAKQLGNKPMITFMEGKLPPQKTGWFSSW